MEDLEGYREARAQQWEGQQRGVFDHMELEDFVSGFIERGGNSEHQQKVARRCGGLCCCLMVLIMSVGSLLPLQYGLTMNWITRQVNLETVYQGGRHLIGPWNTFIAFPSTVVTVSFAQGESNGPLATRTKDGLSLTLHMAFQYRMEPEKLGELFRLSNLQYEPLFVRNARDVLLKAAADYEAFEYWQAREKIGTEMQALLKERLASVYAECTGLQVLQIELPLEFEASIVQTQVQQQEVKTKQNEQMAKKIRADTTVLQASFSRNVTVTKSGADADYTKTTNIARASANQQMLRVEAETMSYTQQRLGLTPSQMVAYQQFASYQALQNASFIYGLKNSVLTIPSNSASSPSR
eukprot:TRINITY_DN54319_c0_g1_i1.p1 TRINITY_DN54319_c0_g1~~TRINITY_DN54319_c0_g1_i1.p1  ORF type:complete len:353 (+),score=78.43 TRINITY_DN54319_c0_g1_i1:69-1127(+)